jgi:uncharacterized protein
MNLGIWKAANDGHINEVERLVGQEPGLLDTKDGVYGYTPLMFASWKGHVGVVRWLLDKGAATDELSEHGLTALWLASSYGHTPVVSLLLERGADPTLAAGFGSVPLMAGCSHLEVVRVLLGHPDAKAAINRRGLDGQTALWKACHWGHKGVVRALLNNGRSPTTRALPPWPSPSRSGLCLRVSPPRAAGGAWRRWR